MNTIELLELFTSEDETRRDLCTPFNVGDFTYATDGRVAVKVPKLIQFESRNIPIDMLFAEVSGSESPFKDLPPLEYCRRCSASGQVKCDIGHWHTCPGCNGKTDYPYVQIGEALFNVFYLAKLEKLDGLKFKPTKQYSQAYFTFNGGEGILMPCRAE